MGDSIEKFQTPNCIQIIAGGKYRDDEHIEFRRFLSRKIASDLVATSLANL